MEIDEIDLGFFLIHVFYIVLFCGCTNLMGAYKIERKQNGVNNMIIFGVKQVLTCPNLLTYYEQDMTKSLLLLEYYNNVYEGHYERW